MLINIFLKIALSKSNYNDLAFDVLSVVLKKYENVIQLLAIK